MKDNTHPNKELDTITSSSTQDTVEKPLYWRSLEEWGQDPEFLKLAEQEFMSSPLREETKNEGTEGWARREFMKLMGASLAMATTGCIRRPVEKIIPYVAQPEQVVLGVPNYYCSSWTDGVETYATLVKTVEGRPIKIEGNPEAPGNAHALSSRAQAHVLSLYDPDRLRGPRRNLLNPERTNRDTISVQWSVADERVVEQLKKGGVAVLTGYQSSPSSRQLIQDFASAFNGRHYVYEALSYDDIRRGQEISFGQNVIPRYRLNEADRVVSIDADFLGTWLTPVAFNRMWAERRRPDENMGRLISFDSTFSLTASNADMRFRIKPSQQLDVALALLAELAPRGGVNNSNLQGLLQKRKAQIDALAISKEQLTRLADDLWQHRGRAVVLAGGFTAGAAWADQLQVAVNLLNSVLGAEGTVIDGTKAPIRPQSTSQNLESLLQAIEKGEVQTLIIHGTNPAYTLPQPDAFLEAIRKVEMVIYTGDRVDETGAYAHYVLPDDHSLEKWGDSDIYSGVVAIQQPTIRPLGETRAFETSLITWARLAEQGPARLTENENWYGYLRSSWQRNLYPSAGGGAGFEDFWNQVLARGYASLHGENFASAGSARSFRNQALEVLGREVTAAPAEYEIAFYTKIPMLDGSMANISWLQELPDPVTKICWDNYASISLQLAETLKLKEGKNIQLSVGGKSLVLPVHIQPGLHDQVVAVALGYGRTAAGRVGNGVGANAYALMGASNQAILGSGQGVEIALASGSTKLANVQGHNTVAGRPIVGEKTLQSYLDSPDPGIHRHNIWSMWPEHTYDGYRWGMTIDLNQCTGCSACVTACQAENNIPVVGKRYVLEGREMHWLMLHRYYSGDTAEPQVTFQVMLCQHCENAPCETVCPVLATVHSDEGLNEMVYNRCVGTRYCANNCPYKVRRFNWFNYAKQIQSPNEMVLNPDVTVRARGVMEKCTFCVQRIQSAKRTARLEDRKVRDGEVKTACQQTCPTNAIIFGDINDPETKVSQAFKQDPRAYALLEEWSTAPSVRYLSKIRNTDGNESDQQHGGEHS